MSKDRGSKKTHNNPTDQVAANGIHGGASSQKGHQSTCMLPGDA
jgi:hypothetical protein